MTSPLKGCRDTGLGSWRASYLHMHLCSTPPTGYSNTLTPRQPHHYQNVIYALITLIYPFVSACKIVSFNRVKLKNLQEQQQSLADSEDGGKVTYKSNLSQPIHHTVCGV